MSPDIPPAAPPAIFPPRIARQGISAPKKEFSFRRALALSLSLYFKSKKG
jgi:hypothetical protein